MNETLLLDTKVVRLSRALAPIVPRDENATLRIVLTYDSVAAAAAASQILSQIKRNPNRLGCINLEVWSLAALEDGGCRMRAAKAAAAADLLLLAVTNGRKALAGIQATWINGELTAQATAPRLILVVAASPDGAHRRRDEIAGLDDYVRQKGVPIHALQIGVSPAKGFLAARGR